MRVQPNSQHEVFLARLRKTKPRFAKWRGIAFRAAPLEYARIAKLLDGMGSLKFGGRWSTAGTFPAVNLALTQAAAIAESGANFTYYNFAPGDVRPKVLVGVQLRLEKVIDLTNPGGLAEELQPGMDQLLAEDWRAANDAGHESQTQALGRAAHDLGAEALLAPSARVPGAKNLIYFPDTSTSRATVTILGQAELEKWLKKR
jgi:RES domain-containing protein